MRWLRRGFLASAVLAELAFPALPASASFSDVPSGHWASPSIQRVAGDRDWMRDFGTGSFRPEALLTRKHLARALALAFPPPPPEITPTAGASETPDSPGAEPGASPSPEGEDAPAPNPTESPAPAPPPMAFTDLADTDPFHPHASMAVDRGWMKAPGGAFRPDGTVAKYELDYALASALGLRREMAALARISTVDGFSFGRTTSWAAMVLAGELRLHHNHPTGDEARELLPRSAVRRADAAYAFARAADAAGGRALWGMARYRSIVLPAMDGARRRALAFAMDHVGYPYVWAGEWARPTPAGYCCGRQVTGGFDCSGFAWWVMKAPSGSWNNTRIRGYAGWSLPQRSSRDIAANVRTRRPFSSLQPLDLMFFTSDLRLPDRTGINHTGLSMGNGWMIHSSGGRDGVTISWVADGWWREHFRWGRRLI